jgi:threonine dehydratase
MTDADTMLPTLGDVREAAAAIAPLLSLPTPLVASPGLSEMLDADVWLKCEFANPIGVFKLRGGLNLARQLTDAQREAGLVTASTGNHGQSIAYSAQLGGVPATVFVPVGANVDKVASMRRLGAAVVERGEAFDDARVAAEEYAAETGARYVHSANEPALIAGVGTAALEVLELQRPHIDVVIVPVGGGSGVCGWLTVRDGLAVGAEIWGVQSSQSPAAHDAWRAGRVLEGPNRTRAEGLATGVAFELTQQIMRASLDDFLLVDDDRIEDAVALMLDVQHLLVEPAGAASLAAAVQERERLRGRSVTLVLSGANITRPQLLAILADRSKL